MAIFHIIILQRHNLSEKADTRVQYLHYIKGVQSSAF